jgi:hypothetical protein
LFCRCFLSSFSLPSTYAFLGYHYLFDAAPNGTQTLSRNGTFNPCLSTCLNKVIYITPLVSSRLRLLFLAVVPVLKPLPCTYAFSCITILCGCSKWSPTLSTQWDLQ